MDSTTIPDILGDILSVLSCRNPPPSSIGDEQLPTYNYPSAGHLYPVQTLVHVPTKSYLGYYHPLNNCLVELPLSKKLQGELDKHKPEDNGDRETIAYLIMVAERDAIEPVYGEDLSKEFCYLEAGYMVELIHMNLQDILEQHNPPSTAISSISLPPPSEDDKLSKELGLTPSQFPLHMLLLTQSMYDQ